MTQPGISIVIPSLANIQQLERLIESIETQRLDFSIELLICLTTPTPVIVQQIEELSRWGVVKCLITSKKNISAARNVGLKNAQFSLVLFLDEDCFLPHSFYLQNIFNLHLNNQNICGGGFYQSQLNSNMFTKFYNFMCNVWLVSKKINDLEASVLLGGCSFYPLSLIKNNFFNEDLPRAGEEYSFNQHLVLKGLVLRLNPEWSCVHAPHLTFKEIIKKAWTQGKNIQSVPIDLSNRFAFTFKYLLIHPKEAILFSLPLLAYFFVGRIAKLLSAIAKTNPLPSQNCKPNEWSS